MAFLTPSLLGGSGGGDDAEVFFEINTDFASVILYSLRRDGSVSKVGWVASFRFTAGAGIFLFATIPDWRLAHLASYPRVKLLKPGALPP